MWECIINSGKFTLKSEVVTSCTLEMVAAYCLATNILIIVIRLCYVNKIIIAVTTIVTGFITVKMYAIALMYFVYLNSYHVVFTKDFGLFTIRYQEDESIVIERLLVKYKNWLLTMGEKAQFQTAADVKSHLFFDADTTITVSELFNQLLIAHQLAVTAQSTALLELYDIRFYAMVIIIIGASLFVGRLIFKDYLLLKDQVNLDHEVQAEMLNTMSLSQVTQRELVGNLGDLDVTQRDIISTMRIMANAHDTLSSGHSELARDYHSLKSIISVEKERLISVLDAIRRQR